MADDERDIGTVFGMFSCRNFKESVEQARRELREGMDENIEELGR